LSCRANHPHIVIVARISKKPRREIGRGFLVLWSSGQWLRVMACFQFRLSEKDLTCRANHLYLVIVARIKTHGREIGCGFFSFTVEQTLA
jgi:hypothetical protein